MCWPSTLGEDILHGDKHGYEGECENVDQGVSEALEECALIFWRHFRRS